MVAVEEVDLDALGVRFPEDGVGIVVAQPYAKLDEPPFAHEGDAKDRLVAAVEATLQVALSRRHQATKTHFTLFPEYAVPLEGVARIDAAMASDEWPVGTVVIGGIEGLTPERFRALVSDPNTHCHPANGIDRLHDAHWVNCSVTWVKPAVGGVQRWIQPKLSPAWPERDLSYNSMYRGSVVYAFKGLFDQGHRGYRFCSLLCFDWVAAVGNKLVWRWVLEETQAKAPLGAQLPFTWLFLLQFNDQPCHASFMGQVPNFFNAMEYPAVERIGACLVMANVAGKDKPGEAEDYGRSAAIHAPQQFGKTKCMPTYSNGGEKFRPGNPLANFCDSVFRENGACIHSFFLVDPKWAPPGAAGRREAVREATVHRFPNLLGDEQRANGDAVPAVIKWLHDNLDVDRSLAKNHPTYRLAQTSATPSTSTGADLRKLKWAPAEHTVRVGCVTVGKTPDDWGQPESNAVEHISNTLSLLRLAGFGCEIHGALAHATIQGKYPFDLVAVRGRTHQEVAVHVANSNLRSRLPLVIVSRDDDNSVWGAEEMTIYQTQQTEAAPSEVKITDPESAIRRVGYQTLLEAFRTSDSIEQLMEKLDAALYQR